ncbi:MAG: sensor histidine kinase [Gemmatimonadaceae bacterium]|nr:sensor histidine kinase [Gemmatimonadaceae bacterium]
MALAPVSPSYDAPSSSRRDPRRDDAVAAVAAPSSAGETWQWVLRVPLVTKLVGVNTCITVVAVVASVVLHAQPIGNRGILLVVVVAAAGALVANYLLVSFALLPVRQLERTASAVAAGDYEARVPDSVMADHDLRSAGATVNALLDRLLTDRERLRRFSVALIGAEAREKARVARELNESTAQALSALVLQLAVARQEAPTSPALEEAHRLASDVLEEVRLLARTVYPRVLEDLGLPAALAMLAREARGRVPQAEITVTVHPAARALDATVASVLYTVAHEALGNAVRHADAHRIDITLTRSGQWARLSVRDDGIGFDVGASERVAGGGGLFAIRERVALMDGRCAVTTAPGEGTEVVVDIPIELVRGS